MVTTTFPQEPWHTAGQATLADGDGKNNSATAFDLSYGSTYVTTDFPHAAQNPDSRGLTGAVRLPIQAGGVLLRFLVADTEDDGVACTIWLWDSNGGAFDALVINPVRAGAAPVGVHPVSGESLTNFFYADSLTVTQDNVAHSVEGTVDGIAEISFGTKGRSHIFADFDINLPAGTDGTDGICIFKQWTA